MIGCTRKAKKLVEGLDKKGLVYVLYGPGRIVLKSSKSGNPMAIK
jgi:hypothetical protein